MIVETGGVPDEMIANLFALFGQQIDYVISRYGKLIYEIDAICLSYPERAVTIKSKIRAYDESHFAFFKTMELIEINIENGTFRPTMSKEDISMLIISAIQGIIRTVIFNQNVTSTLTPKLDSAKDTTAEDMMKTLAKAVLQLLSADKS